MGPRLWIPLSQAERRAASKPARIPSGDRPMVPSDEGSSFARAERRAAPKPARIPSGDRPMVPSDEGSSFSGR